MINSEERQTAGGINNRRCEEWQLGAHTEGCMRQASEIMYSNERTTRKNNSKLAASMQETRELNIKHRGKNSLRPQTVSEKGVEDKYMHG